MNPSEAFIKDAGAYGGAPMGLERRATPQTGNRQMRFSVTGTAPGGHTTDQASLFFAETDSAIDSNHALATVSPASSKFTNAQVGDFVANVPQHLRNVNVTGADTANTIASMQLQAVRFTPFEDEQSEKVYASGFQTAADQIQTRVQIPLSLTVDGYNSLRILNDANATPASYTATITVGPTLDQRSLVPETGAAVLKSSSGAG